MPHWTKDENKDAVLYIHFPCFDGVISGVLARLYLEKAHGWDFRGVEALNYDLRDTWLNQPLAENSAVVDFLYHPRARFWADHHPTTFLNDFARKDYQSRPGEWALYNPQSRSCASLLWPRLMASGAEARLKEMVDWAEKIDSASYDSVEEALFGVSPALTISRSLAIDADCGYGEFLVQKLLQNDLQDVAGAEQVQSRWRKAQAMSKAGETIVAQAIRLQDGIARFDAAAEDGVLINRYLPYYYYPEARYSIGIVRFEHKVKITAMRNPWREFESVHLGEMMRKFGGGGHRRVGSLILQDGAEATIQQIASQLQQEIAARHEPDEGVA